MQFGKATVTMKAGAGQGIISSFILISDDLDEIDFEFLGNHDQDVQTNWFGKGVPGNYDREQDKPAANNQDQYHRYTIEYTKVQVNWYVDDKLVRTLTPKQAAAQGYSFPQSPMQIRISGWSGGGDDVAQGTKGWASGVNPEIYDYTIDYSRAMMYVKAVEAEDYSSGTTYSYTADDGTWQHIQAGGNGVVGAYLPSAAAPGAVGAAAVSSDSGQKAMIPPAMGGHDKFDTSTMTGWPWVATATPSASSAGVTAAAVDGWVVNSEGKVVPANSGAAVSMAPSFYPAGSCINILIREQSPSPPSTFSSSYVPLPSASSPALALGSGGSETPTRFNDKGLSATGTVSPSSQSSTIGHDDQGISTLTAPSMSTTPVLPGQSLSQGKSAGNVMSTASAEASACQARAFETGILGIAALAVGLLA